MRAVFTSVTRLFRRPSFLTAARSHPTTTSSSSPTRTRKGKGKGKSKSRHELVSDAHIAYMQQASESTFSHSSPSSYSSSSPSSSSLSLPFSSTWMEESSHGCCDEEGEASTSSPAFESLCHELRRVEESVSRYLNEPSHFYH